jgi:catechol 2,3-dioxygenase-like lactoylglutathione lyase family enzyme
MPITGLHHVTLLIGDREKATWFYGQVLGLEEKPRPKFDFPGLFYFCGGQEIHLIVAAQMPPHGELTLRLSDGTVINRRYIHRHAAMLVADLPALRQRLEANGIEILFQPEAIAADDALAQNMIAGWQRMYGQVPIFCADPFGNLLELVPAVAR